MTTDDDLLQPVLKVSDDAVGFDRPWHPSWLVFVAFFGGLGAGAWLLAENWRKLGQPERARPLAIGLTAVWVALVAGMAWVQLHGWPGIYTAGDAEHARNLRYAVRLGTLGVALAIAHRQQARWKIFAAHGGEAEPLFMPALGAILIATLIQLLIVTAVTWAAP